MNTDLISVIVPVYKVETYLKKCIDSILAQTYQNLEIILVDDGSPDRCGEICDGYAKLDSRIVVIHKENGGLSDARNAGLDICKGKYVTFVDSDDSIRPEYVEYLYSLIQANNADLSICEFRYVTEAGNTLNKPWDDGLVLIMDSREALRNLCYGKLYYDSAWAKLYRTCDFEGIRYPKGKLFEDIPTTYRVMLRAEKLVFGKRALYDYLYRKEAISKQSFNTQRLDAMYYVENQYKDIIEVYPELESACATRKFTEYIYIYKNICTSKGNYKKIKHQIYHKIKECKQAVDVNQLSLKFKCYFYVSAFGMWFLILMAKMETIFSRKYKRMFISK